MIKGLYTAHTGMINQMNRMDVLTNNLANADTNGFKKEGATTQSFDDVLAFKIKDTSTNGIPTNLGYISLGVKVGEVYTDYSQGSYRETGNSYDVALDGQGFFAISFTNKDGETSFKFTRDGAFTVTTDGYLVTKDGDYVLNKAAALAGDPGQAGFIRLDPNAETTIDENGNIFQNDVFVAQLGVMDVDNYETIEKYGENMYELVEEGNIIDSNATVNQGYLEMSNVNVVSEMVEMIQISRAYESNQKLIQTIDSMTDVAVTQIGKV